MESATVIVCGLSLAEVVALNLIGVCSKPFPVDLVQSVGLQYETADDTRAWRGLNLNIHLSEHDVPQRSKLRCIAGLSYGERHAIIAVCGVALGCETLRFRREVDVDGPSERRIWGAVASQCGVAVGPCLGGGGGNEGDRGQSSECSHGGAHLGCDVTAEMAGSERCQRDAPALVVQRRDAMQCPRCAVISNEY